MIVMNVVILGRGYIGTKILPILSRVHNTNLISRQDIDYTSLCGLAQIKEQYNPDIIVNCYGYTGRPNVDSCEDNKIECRSRNVMDNLVIHKNSPTPTITISSGCIYNNDTNEIVAYSEDDPHNFGKSNPTASYYSQCKSEFEERLKYGGYLNRDYLLRIRMPFDNNISEDKNYIGKILKYNKLVNYPNSLTYIPDLADCVNDIISLRPKPGIYNIVNPGAKTAQDILNTCSSYIYKKRFYSTDDLLSQNIMKCRRSNCVLSVDKITEALGRPIPSAHQRLIDVAAANNL